MQSALDEPATPATRHDELTRAERLSILSRCVSLSLSLSCGCSCGAGAMSRKLNAPAAEINLYQLGGDLAAKGGGGSWHVASGAAAAASNLCSLSAAH